MPATNRRLPWRTVLSASWSRPAQTRRPTRWTGPRLGERRSGGRQNELNAAELEAALQTERVDVTLPVDMHPEGALHPITALINDMCDVFVAMGWEVAEGPELESEWLNFDSLNIGPDHPARGLSDTLFVEPASVSQAAADPDQPGTDAYLC
jgi:phenylalanyl-tRNA synthetase alpha chain